MTQVKVVSGDIAQVNADALITAIRIDGSWCSNLQCGCIDSVIQRAAGKQFHEQIATATLLSGGQTIVARNDGPTHGGAFANVVFVVDDYSQPLRRVIYSALAAASDAGLRTVSLPMIRMGAALGLVEATVDEVINEVAQGTKTFLAEYETAIENITFVVYRDPAIEKSLEQAFV